MHYNNPTSFNGRINRLIGGILALLGMLILKGHYSTATAGQLTWMLAPTARLTAWLTSAHPVWEAGTGYVDFSRGIIIAPACAGINFMIMAFGLAAFSGLLRIFRLAPLLAWLVLSLAGAYGLALGVNAVRIAISMRLYQAEIHWAWLTVDRVHRLAGIGVYLGALGLFFKILETIINCYCNRSDPRDRPAGLALPAWLPLGWYLLGAVGVPTANLLFRNPTAGFGEHCVTVILAGLTLYAGGRLIRWIGGQFSNPGLPEKRRRPDGERFNLAYEQSTDCGG
jgi:exosortase K